MAAGTLDIDIPATLPAADAPTPVVEDETDPLETMTTQPEEEANAPAIDPEAPAEPAAPATEPETPPAPAAVVPPVAAPAAAEQPKPAEVDPEYVIWKREKAAREQKERDAAEAEHAKALAALDALETRITSGEIADVDAVLTVAKAVRAIKSKTETHDATIAQQREQAAIEEHNRTFWSNWQSQHPGVDLAKAQAEYEKELKVAAKDYGTAAPAVAMDRINNRIASLKTPAPTSPATPKPPITKNGATIAPATARQTSPQKQPRTLEEQIRAGAFGAVDGLD